MTSFSNPTSHQIAVKRYNRFKRKEVSHFLPKIGEFSTVIVRLDGKGLTKKFLRKTMFDEKHFIAMKKMLESIVEYFPYISYAYSVNDEVSFVIKKEKLSSQKIDNRLEKLLSYLAGFVSSLYTLNRNDEGKKTAFSFDARVLVLNEKAVVDSYFLSRQRISIGYFIEKLCKKHSLKQKVYSMDEIRKALIDHGDNWDNYPSYVPYGFVGYYDEQKWKVQEGNNLEHTMRSKGSH